MSSEVRGSGVAALADKINQLVREGNVRRIVVHNDAGRTVLDLPVNAGIVALLVAPMLSVAASALAMAGGWTVRVERDNEPTEESKQDG